MKRKSVWLFLLALTIRLYAGNNNGDLPTVISPPPARTAMVLISVPDLKPFYVDKYEVSNRDYQKFVQATGHPAPEFWNSREYRDFSRSNRPVVCVSWEDAVSYASWAGKRLPTEVEWEVAACLRQAGGQTGNFCSDSTIDVKSFPEGVSPYGVYNMLGNVWEWCNDWYDEDGRVTGCKVVRGGSFLCSLDILRTTLRGYADPKDKVIYCGFRCARDAK